MLQYQVSSDFSQVVFTAEIAFSKRSWPYLMTMAVPWLLFSGQRCITRLASWGEHKRSLSGYYRFLSDGKWRMLVLFHCLFDLVVSTFNLAELTLVLDDTLCPKWGRKIFGTGSFFDHVARPKAGYVWGHNWVVLAVVVQLGRQAWVALPFWISLYRAEKQCPPGEFRTRHQLAHEALRAVRAWFPGPITLLADGAYNNISILQPLRGMGISLVSRMRCDAVLREPSPPRRAKGTRGRKPKYGKKLPGLPALAKHTSAFTLHKVTIYGHAVSLLLREIVAWWPAARCLVKVVISRDPKRPKRIAYLMSSKTAMTGVQVVEMFARRWSIEQLFSVAKNHLGLDSAEVRRENSVRRHAALCMALVTWCEVWIYRFRPKLRHMTFAQGLFALRSETIAQTIFASGPRSNLSGQIAKNIASLYAAATSAA